MPWAYPIWEIAIKVRASAALARPSFVLEPTCKAGVFALFMFIWVPDARHDGRWSRASLTGGAAGRFPQAAGTARKPTETRLAQARITVAGVNHSDESHLIRLNLGICRRVTLTKVYPCQ